MAATKLDGVLIRGIAAAVPNTEQSVENLAGTFGGEVVAKTRDSTGVRSMRIAGPRQCASDLCFTAAKNLLAELEWSPESVGLVVFVSQTPDYILPATSNILQHRLGLTKECLAIDLSQGCSGYVTGLWTAASLCRTVTPTRTLLLVGDTPTKFVREDDLATRVLFGDAGSATALEAVSDAPALHFLGGSDGGGASQLIVSGGGFRNLRSEGCQSPWGQGALEMNGAEIFAFTSREVPQLVKGVIASAGWTSTEADLLVLHQANKFLLDHLSRKIKFPGRVPISLDRFGNTSSASIPLTIADACAKTQPLGRAVLAGFGVGYSWAAAACDLSHARILPVMSTDEAFDPQAGRT
jgi:3-oxoacyl-[acyl-carrier-protein] synthase III